ncbi:MAG: flagellar biosynthetic protein FliO [Pseudodesulfovibrio sp.]
MQLPVVDTWSTMLTTLGYLCLLLGVMFLAYWLLRRFGLTRLTTQGGAEAPRLMGRLMLGQRHSVVVVRHRGRDLLLGVTENSITRLAEDPAGGEDGGPSPESAPFASLLKRNLGK